jgi:NitT/TauT family transport system substrate-binding protein
MQVTKVDKLRLGYLLNMTHAVPIVGLESGKFTKTESLSFTSGGYLLDALLTHNLDLGYIGPGPYINALSKGVKLKLLKVSCIGGNSLILPSYYETDKKFNIKKIAVPQWGNTQDLLAKILVNHLQDQAKRYEASHPQIQSLMDLPLISFDKKLQYIPIHPAELEMAFFTASIDAALVAEPWGTLLASKGMINLTDLADNPPSGLIEELEGSPNAFIYDQLKFINQFPTTLLVVDSAFYKVNKDLVDNFVKEQDQILKYLQTNEAESISLIQKHLVRMTKKDMKYDFLLASFKKVIFTETLDQDRFDDLIKVSFRAKYLRSSKLKMITELLDE